MSRNVVSCMQPADQANDFRVDSNGTDGKPTFRRHANQSWLFKICNHFADIAAWSRKLFTMFTQKLTFLKKDPLWTNFLKCFPKGFTTSQIPVLCANFVKFGWPEIGKVVHYLRDKKTKFRLALPLSLLHGSCPKSVRASSRLSHLISVVKCNCVQVNTHIHIYIQYTQSSPKFHPNAFTSCRVIAGRVNIVETRHKVFPIAIKCFQYSAKLQLLRGVIKLNQLIKDFKWQTASLANWASCLSWSASQTPAISMSFVTSNSNSFYPQKTANRWRFDLACVVRKLQE